MEENDDQQMMPEELLAALERADAQARELACILDGRLGAGPEGCIEWNGGMTGAGQPTARLHGQRVALPRMVWTAFQSDRAAPQVFRTCKNPRCISPGHLSSSWPREGVKLAKRMLDSLDLDGQDCLMWPGATSARGYGVLFLPGGRCELVHRWSWQQTSGPIPDGYVIAHSCGEPACFHPAHLICCTPAQRVAATAQQRRFPHGEQHWNHKITRDQAAEIRSSPTPAQDLVCRYPLGLSAIKDIRAGPPGSTTRRCGS